ncbi:MAG: hypothetical protein ACE5GM_07230 [bacterium]
MFKYYGCTGEEEKFRYAVDRYAEEGAEFVYRSILIEVPSPRVFPWITQLRYAPYSYDLIDNWGRESPRYLITDAPPLKVGDSVMRWFELIDFKQNEYIVFTLLKDPPFYLKLLFYPFVKSFYITYQLFPQKNNNTRLVVKIVVNSYHTVLHKILCRAAYGLDYIMMRRQLLNFKGLAERALNP